jgi:hypothetical protein
VDDITGSTEARINPHLGCQWSLAAVRPAQG